MNPRAYIKRLVEEFGVENCNVVHTPADSNSKRVKPSKEEAFVAMFPYGELVGALMSAARSEGPRSISPSYTDVTSISSSEFGPV